MQEHDETQSDSIAQRSTAQEEHQYQTTTCEKHYYDRVENSD
jgi:hypothetical protein